MGGKKYSKDWNKLTEGVVGVAVSPCVHAWKPGFESHFDSNSTSKRFGVARLGKNYSTWLEVIKIPKGKGRGYSWPHHRPNRLKFPT